MRECDAMTSKHPLLMTSSKDCGSTVPPVSSTLATASVMIVALAVTEHLTRALLFSIKVGHVYVLLVCDYLFNLSLCVVDNRLLYRLLLTYSCYSTGGYAYLLPC
jgi:hypothetical protein